MRNQKPMTIIEKTRKLTKENNKSWDQPIARKFPRPMAIEIETGKLLYGLIRAIKPTNVVETGTFEGFSAVNIAKALKKNGEGFLYTIDIKDYGSKEIFKEYGVDKWIESIIGLSPRTLEEIASVINIDFTFLDGEHSYNAVYSELEVLHKHIRAGSYITGHDYCRYKSIKQAVDEFVKKYSPMYEKVIISTFAGVFILRKSTET